jgi:hypothetical protein
LHTKILGFTLSLAAFTLSCLAATNSSVSSPSTTAPKALAQGCTLFVSAQGSDRNSGTTPSSPITLLGAASQARAGDDVCLMGGSYSLSRTFSPSHSGNPYSWILFESYGDSNVNIAWTAGANASDKNMFHFYNSVFPNGPSYLEFRGLTLDGQNAASNGFFCQGSHHLRFTDNTIKNTGGAGIGSVLCDYLTSNHNTVYHNGYHGGWTSGISYNSNQWFDRYQGLHNVIANNIVVGEYDSSSYHTDGNGIIMDLSSRSYDPTTANTPPALIVNNVVYGNGGRCIQNYVVTNIWVVNNTCYDNGLDLSLGGVSSISSHNASDEYFFNNIVVTWGGMHPFIEQGTINQNVAFGHNLIYGGADAGFTDTNPTHFTTAAPAFVNPPKFNATGDGQYATALDPSLLGNGLHLRAGSPGIGVGVDPSTLSRISPAIISDMKEYLYTDRDGNPRPQGGPFNLGAYQQ